MLVVKVPAIYLSILMVSRVIAKENPYNGSFNKLESAIVVSQLVMAQQAEYFKKLISVAKESKNCINLRGSSYECPYPFTQVVDECFYVSKSLLKWEEARQFCQGMGGDLAIPRNLYALKAHLIEIKAPRAVWIGGTYLGPEEGWRWINGASVNEEEWSPKQPSGARKNLANCLNIRRDRHPVLDDVLCGNKLRFVCQYSL
ncbi:C-type lectin domain family 4 member G-like [Palaemon carinicauda]|uniref:C-type lectin domain family 4 member G-like n=1 Tax=Palaemon carinicauda TaxID=392227 RepID=UPI0035B6897C